MSAPLVILAVGAILGGGINFPAWHLDFLSKFLSPLFPAASFVTVSTGTKWVLSLITTAVALTGLGLGLNTWRTAYHPQLEPNFLRRAWYFDDLVAAMVSGLRVAATGLAFVMDRKVVDGVVNGTPLSWPLRPGGAQGAERLPPQLRSRHRRRGRHPAGLSQLQDRGLRNGLPYPGRDRPASLGVALIVALLPESAVGNVGRALAFSTAAAELALALWTVVAFKTGNAHAGFQFTSKEAWIGPLGISWYVGVDGISLFLMTMTALLFPIAMASPRVEHFQHAPTSVGCCCSSRRAWRPSCPWTPSCSSSLSR